MFSRSKVLVLLSAMVLLSACGKKASFQDGKVPFPEEVEQAVKSRIYDENVAYRAHPHGFFSMGPMTSTEKEQMMISLDQKVHVTDLKCNEVPGKENIQNCNAILIDGDDNNNREKALGVRLTRGDDGSLIVISLGIKKYGQ